MIICPGFQSGSDVPLSMSTNVFKLANKTLQLHKVKGEYILISTHLLTSSLSHGENKNGQDSGHCTAGVV